VTVGPEGTKITLGDTTVTVVPTPGHTPGTLSYVFPVKDQGKTVMIAYSSGTLTGGFGADGARWDEYIASQKRIAGVAAEVGPPCCSRTTAIDGAYTKARLVPLKREAGRGQSIRRGRGRRTRYFTVMQECAIASKLRAGAK
jgi:metallo-beta-lactamase class B